MYGKVLREEFAELKLKHYNTYAGTKTAVNYTIWKSSDGNKKEAKWDARLLVLEPSVSRHKYILVNCSEAGRNHYKSALTQFNRLYFESSHMSS